MYNYTDHLGNIRLSYVLDPATHVLKILEENYYYPFGLKHTNYNSGKKGIVFEELTESKMVKPVEENGYFYKYNDKEWQDELGLNVYAYGWRDYDPAIGRFTKIDRFAEKYFSVSSYNYAGNNPVLFVDIAGDSIGSGRDHFNKFKNEVINMRNKILSERQREIDRLYTKGDVDGSKRLEDKYEKIDSEPDSKMAVLNQTLNELNMLEASEQIYNLIVNSPDVSPTSDGNVTYDVSSRSVNVNIRGVYNMGRFAHELKHAFQFQIGALSFNETGKLGGYLYDLNNEYEAFSRGAFFNGTYKSKDDINKDYSILPKGPYNIDTVIPGRGSLNVKFKDQLQSSTYRSSTYGTAQQQFYINWEKDVKK